jgi:murein DD-endopeptidase MepM/ murein hydrolase activator NlpD
MSFKPLNSFEVTKIPEPGHPGSFGTSRKFDVHTGVDLYCKNLEDVSPMKEGTVVRVGSFTGEKTNTPWWNDTDYIMVRSDDEVLLYGEVTAYVKVGQYVKRGDLIGRVKQVLKKDKGLPMSMLHVEMYDVDFNEEPVEWKLGEEKPDKLLDPTELLKSIK